LHKFAKGTQTKKQIIKTIRGLEDDTRRNRLNLDDYRPSSPRSVVSWNNDIKLLKNTGFK
jgi:hypothetical protein